LASIVLNGRDKSPRAENRGSQESLQLLREEIKMLPETKSTSRAQVKWPVTMNTDEGPVDGVITNINNNGAFIRCRKPLRLTETCKLTIESSERQIQNVVAEVVWTNIYGPDDDLTPRGMGVRFTDLPEREQKFFRGLIRMIKGERGVEKISGAPEIDLDQTTEVLH
jgi:PilZ domain